MKRILIFSLVYYPRYIGGAEIAIKEITDRVDPGAIEFHMVTLRSHKDLLRYEKIGNVHVYRTGLLNHKKTHSFLASQIHTLNKHLFPFFAYWRARTLHKTHHYDAIWSMMANYAGFAASFFKSRYPSVPFILTLQEGDPIDHIKRRVQFVYPLFKNIFRRADFVQAISNYLAAFARNMGFTGPLAVVPNGVDVSLFTHEYSKEELDLLKQRLVKKEGDIFLVTTSRLVKKNGVTDIITALQYLPSHVRLLVIGTGKLFESLKRQAESMNVSDRVSFLGFIDHEEMPKYLKVSDIFIRPSLSEGFGNSFIEAMAVGLPVIGTQEGGIADFLFDQNRNPDRAATGWVVDKSNPKQISQTVQSIISHPSAAQKIALYARKAVVERYGWDLIATKMVDNVFDKI